MKKLFFATFAIFAFLLSSAEASAATPGNAYALPETETLSEMQQTTGTPMRVRVSIFNLIGIKLSPCLISLLAEVKVYQDMGNGVRREVEYLCPDDRSEVIYVNVGQRLTIEANLLGRDLLFDKEVIVDNTMISENGIIDVSFTLDLEL